MIEISEETSEKLHCLRDEIKREGFGGDVAELLSIIETIPRPTPKREPCPVCLRDPRHYASMGHWSCDCGATGPSNDFNGSKWDAMARPARVLRDIETWARECTTFPPDSISERYGPKFQRACQEILSIIGAKR